MSTLCGYRGRVCLLYQHAGACEQRQPHTVLQCGLCCSTSSRVWFQKTGLSSSSTLRVSLALNPPLLWSLSEPLVDSLSCREGSPYILRSTGGASVEPGRNYVPGRIGDGVNNNRSFRAGYDKHVSGPERLPASVDSEVTYMTTHITTLPPSRQHILHK